jgi:hypothetical protein
MVIFAGGPQASLDTRQLRRCLHVFKPFSTSGVTLLYNDAGLGPLCNGIEMFISSHTNASPGGF